MRSISVSTFGLAIVGAVLGCGLPRAAYGDTQKWAGEYDLKVAFVYNIVAFVDWPQGVLGDQVIVGFAGEGPMDQVMGKFLTGKHIGSRGFEVRAVHTSSELRACNVVFVDYPDRSRTLEAISSVRDKNVLTIGGGESFAKLGGTIGLVAHDNTFGLAINRQSAERARLSLSSRLLSIAKLVSEDQSS